MKIAYDENMPYAAQLFGQFGEVVCFAGRQCNAETVADADVLLVRSITKVNQTLLADASKLQFVGTATIGTDHISQQYLASRGIAFHSAPGCNAISVGEYVLSAIKVLEQQYLFNVVDKVVGVVGAGNTGSAVAKLLRALGVRVLLCDPPLALAKRAASGRNCLDAERLDGDHVSIEYVDYKTVLQQADIISFHVPLVLDGEYPTVHLFGANELATIKPDAMIINACRGEVIDNHALLAAKRAGNNNPLVLDVWEGEPQVLMPLIDYADIATAHIAGYSFEGKARGTFMLYQALCQHLGVEPTVQLSDLLPTSAVFAASVETPRTEVDLQLVSRLVHLSYDVRRDDGIFRQHIAGNGFDWIRKNFPVRREFSAITVNGQPSATLNALAELGFITRECEITGE